MQGFLGKGGFPLHGAATVWSAAVVTGSHVLFRARFLSCLRVPLSVWDALLPPPPGALLLSARPQPSRSLEKQNPTAWLHWREDTVAGALGVGLEGAARLSLLVHLTDSCLDVPLMTGIRY